MEITDEENECIVREPSKVELKMVLNSIPKDNIPRSNNFGLGFYETWWDFVKEDLLEDAKEIF